jgi:rfaE bifunctional protein nucleotidyltransferase chain/domain
MKTSDTRKKIVSLPQLLAQRAIWRREGRTVVWTNGCFDVVHVGHVRNLEAAAAEGDVLVVGLNSDASTRRLKGPSRPIVPQNERAELLAALSCVDAVYIYEDDTAIPALREVQPEFYCKGSEYAPPNGKFVPEAETVHAYGGQIRYMPQIPDRSTTDLVKRILERAQKPGEK